MKTYNQIQINLPSGYEYYDYFYSRASPDVTFSALRYEDGKNVMGRITPTGDVTIEKVLDRNSKIVNLIPIN